MYFNSNYNKYFQKFPLKNALKDVFCEVYIPNDFEEIPDNLLGLYSWYHYPHVIDSAAIKSYLDTCKNKNFKVELSSNLNEKYIGNTVNAQNIDTGVIEKFDLYNSNPLFNNLFQIATLNFSPPIYIGRSKNIKRRLISHRNKFKISLSENSSDSITAKITNQNIIENDTEEESSFFGIRLAHLLKKKNIFNSFNYSTANLFVKIISFKSTAYEGIPDNEMYDFIKDVEYLMLRTYHPIISKK